MESAWHGNDDTWRFQVIGPQGPSGHLREMVTALRGQGVPTVFWNKEDPAHYDEAIETARLFDWVFTTDEAMVEHYQRDLGHDRVGILPFAAQPTIHNPIRPLGDDSNPLTLRDVAFAGTYFAHKYPERREQMEIVLGGALDVSARLPHGLDIFSRYLDGDDTYQFPSPWDSHVRGSLSYPQMLSAYRAYAVFLNVSSVVGSPSMLPRRVIEVLACGTPVVTTPTPATDRLLPAGTLARAHRARSRGQPAPRGVHDLPGAARNLGPPHLQPPCGHRSARCRTGGAGPTPAHHRTAGGHYSAGAG